MPVSVLACQSAEPGATWVMASRSWRRRVLGTLPTAKRARRAVDGGKNAGVLWVDGLQRSGHIELDFNVVAGLPGAVEGVELAGLGAGGDANAIDSDGGFGSRPGGDAQGDTEGASLVGGNGNLRGRVVRIGGVLGEHDTIAEA